MLVLLWSGMWGKQRKNQIWIRTLLTGVTKIRNSKRISHRGHIPATRLASKARGQEGRREKFSHEYQWAQVNTNWHEFIEARKGTKDTKK